MIINHTSFAAEFNAGWDHLLQQYYVIVLAAAVEVKPGWPVSATAEPATLHPADVYFGEPGRSSVRYEADFAPEKPRVDVLVNGRAYAPGGGKAERVQVSVRVGDIFKELVVVGDREDSGMLGAFAKPRPFDTLPIVYERAYGGCDMPSNDSAKYRLDMRNPVGIGYYRARSADPKVQSVVPNVEYADGRSEPAGFGVVARNWQSRIRFAGTYDQAWLRDRSPLLPDDFDPRYHQAAPLDQQSDTIRGGEAVEVLNMTAEGSWRFRLPTLDVPIHLWYADRGEKVALRLDTVLLEPDLYRVTLTARVKIPIVRNRGPLQQVIVGHISGGWWRSILNRKLYFDPLSLNGRVPSEKGYRE